MPDTYDELMLSNAQLRADLDEANERHAAVLATLHEYEALLRACQEENERGAADLDEARGNVDRLTTELASVRHDRKVAEEAAHNGTWVWSDTDPNDLETMGAEMVVTMTAAQLRALLAAHRGADLAAARTALTNTRDELQRVSVAYKKWKNDPGCCEQDRFASSFVLDVAFTCADALLAAEPTAAAPRDSVKTAPLLTRAKRLVAEAQTIPCIGADSKARCCLWAHESRQLAMQLIEHIETVHQSAETPCVTRLVGGEQPTCAYLSDGSKIVVRFGPGANGPCWLEHKPQAKLTTRGIDETP
jgi:hypothetical protein